MRFLLRLSTSLLLTLTCAGTTGVASADPLVVAAPAEPSAPSPPATVASTPARYTAVSGPGRISTSGATHEFYGWQNIVVGGVGASSLVGLGLLASISDGGGGDSIGAAGAVAGLTYVFGSLIVHSLHGHWEKGLGATAILLAAPATSALIGWATSGGCEGIDCRGSYAAWGAVAGMLGAPLIDGLSLGWERRGGERAAIEGNVAFEPTILPSVMPLREGGMMFTLGGQL